MPRFAPLLISVTGAMVCATSANAGLNHQTLACFVSVENACSDADDASACTEAGREGCIEYFGDISEPPPEGPLRIVRTPDGSYKADLPLLQIAGPEDRSEPGDSPDDEETGGGRTSR